jgi:phytanoyl-CoA hydroxylase
MNRRLGCLHSHLRSSCSPPPQRHQEHVSPVHVRVLAARSVARGEHIDEGPVSAEGVASFRANGFLLIKQLVPEEELRQVDADSRELIERGLAGPFGDGRWNYGEDPEGGPPIPRRINGLADDDMPPSFQLLLAYPPLLAAAAALMADVGGDSRAFCAGVPGALVYKVPRRGFPVQWHQDPVVIKRFPAFNVDVYLDDSDEENACVWAIPGSHLAGYRAPADGDAQRHVASWTNGREGKDVPGAVAVRAKRGDVLVHATSVLHGSWWNRSDRMRRTLYYHFDSWEDVNLGGGYASRSDEEAARSRRPT